MPSGFGLITLLYCINTVLYCCISSAKTDRLMQATTCGVAAGTYTHLPYCPRRGCRRCRSLLAGCSSMPQKQGIIIQGIKNGISPAETGGNIPELFSPLRPPRHARHVWSCRWPAALQPRAARKRIRHSDGMTWQQLPLKKSEGKKKREGRVRDKKERGSYLASNVK